MSTGIRLSPKHGLNPAIPVCFFCQKPKNEVVLVGRLKDDKEAPRNAVWNNEPCDECRDLMNRGIVCISVDADKSNDHSNPWRSGGWCVLTEKAFGEIFHGEVVTEAVKKRAAFIEDSAWDMVGLPREHTKDERMVNGSF